ncbi:helix-turn-helix domain-containing protein [Acetobacter cibinongensis]|uniref:HTH cro/C1-type domain-containing protein n=1 Tax=Acetobacter cibinongensis TaxID=146475 RepID=A0A1Z5YRP1_9PROT|nr:helix-turn-helix transcriptional regulator [Acetobacter cibinongensis]OUI99554.1 hypothetical protein HK14_14270 [Acetobacter cibinongensis]
MTSDRVPPRQLASIVAAIIRRERKRCGMTRLELAERLECTENAVFVAESGCASPSLPLLFDMLWIMDCPQSVFLEITEADARLRSRKEQAA